jgi:uncharacterized protein YbjT (DUF2867 family)
LGEGKLAHIDVRDIAAVGVAVLTGAGHSGKTYALTGPELLTTAQAVQAISTANGAEYKFVDVPAEAARDAMVKHGMPGWYADALGELYAGAKAGYAAIATQDVEKLLGRKPNSFAKFAKDYAGKF